MAKRQGKSDIVVDSIVLSVESGVKAFDPDFFSSEALVCVENSLDAKEANVLRGVTVAEMLVEN